MENKNSEDEKEKEKTEESELEEEIEETELQEDLEKASEKIIREDEFQFAQPFEEFASVSIPILEKTKAPAESLEQEVISAPPSAKPEKKEEEDFKYGIAKQKEEAKYQMHEREITAPKRVDIETLGREQFPQIQKAGFISAQERIAPVTPEEYISVKNQEIEKLGRESPFEKKEIKYISGK